MGHSTNDAMNIAKRLTKEATVVKENNNPCSKSGQFGWQARAAFQFDDFSSEGAFREPLTILFR